MTLIQTLPYVCWQCHTPNDYWYRLCADCDAALDSQEDA